MLRDAIPQVFIDGVLLDAPAGAARLLATSVRTSRFRVSAFRHTSRRTRVRARTCACIHAMGACVFVHVHVKMIFES